MAKAWAAMQLFHACGSVLDRGAFTAPVGRLKGLVMTISLYTLSVGTFNHMLTNLARILEMADQNAADRKIGPDVLPAARLAPDMLPLAFQVQSATDRPKLALARITGREAPRWDDGEKTIADLRGRVQKALDLLAGYAPGDLDGLEERIVTFKQGGADVQMAAAPYLLDNVLPHFYFHVTTAYAILRHNGVPVGKRDFVG